MKTGLLFLVALCLRLSGFGQALSPNLAAGKPTVASSIEGPGFASAFAVDRNDQSRWASDYAHSAQPDAQWIYVDLQATYTISQVRINWQRAYGKEYEVQISADAETWQTLRKITGNTKLVNTISGLSGTGRYVRINCLARGTGYGYSILELEITNYNQPPTVGLTSPQAADYPKPAVITLTANAADTDGTITQVAFYADGTLLNVDTTAPYSYTWTNGATGVYDLTAVATDNSGATTISIARRVQIVSDPPVVTLAFPKEGARYLPGETIVIQADASDPDGTVALVEFFANGRLLSSSTTVPYTYFWADAPLGTLTITARATDNNGRTSFDQKTITVAAPDLPGRVEAESYSFQSGTRTEPTTDAGGGLSVGYIDAGDYLNYKLTATNAGYSVSFRVATWMDGAQLQLRSLFGLEGVATLATVTLPNTGGGQQWQTVTVDNITLINGEQTLQVYALTNGFNFNWMDFSRLPQASARAASAVAGPDPAPLLPALAGYPNPAADMFYLAGVAEGAPVTIHDATGRQLRATTLHAGAVDVRPLPAGLYVLRVRDGDGKTRAVKLLKQ